MSVVEFRRNLYSIKKFIGRLGKEAIPFSSQRILLKTYAKDLNIYLSDNMIEVLLTD